MSSRSCPNAVRATLATLDRFGATLPTKVRKTVDDGLQRTLAVTQWRPEEKYDVNLTRSAYSALTEGRDPAEDPQMLQALIMERLVAIRPSVEQQAGQELAALIREHFDPIVAGLDAAYQTHAAEPVRTHRDTLLRRGIDSPDTDSNFVFSRGAEVSLAWAGMLAAHQAHQAILNAYTVLRGAVGYMPSADAALLWVDPEGADLIEVRELGGSPHPWAVLDAGMALSVTTPSGAAERQRQAAERTEERSREREAEQLEATRRRLGNGTAA